MINNIIINFPTNLGDVIMSLPVLDGIRLTYPKSKITAISSPRTKAFLLANNSIDEVVVFNKRWRIREKIRFSLYLRGKYEIMVDLKNSLLPLLLGVKKMTPFFRSFRKHMHIKDAHLKIASKFIKEDSASVKSEFDISDEKKAKWDKLNLGPSLFIACSSLSSVKSYAYISLKKVLQNLIEKNFSLVVVGEEKDRNYYGDILDLKGIVDLVGETTMSDVIYLFKNYAHLLLGVDSALLHLGGYLNIPIVALFGPTDVILASPMSEKFIILNDNGMKMEPGQVVEAIEKIW